jgi:hypothetical protein
MSDIFDVYYHQLEKKDHDNAFNNAFDLDAEPSLQQRFDEMNELHTRQIAELQRQLTDSRQHCYALQEMNNELQMECGKKAKLLSELRIQHTYSVNPAIAEMAKIITQLEATNRRLIAEIEHLKHSAAIDRQADTNQATIEQLQASNHQYQERNKGLEEQCFASEQTIKRLEERLIMFEQKNAELQQSILVHQEHSDLYFAYSTLPPTWKSQWEHDLIHMMQELKERLPVHMWRCIPTDNYSRINKAIEKVLIPFHEHLYAQITLIPEEPLFIHYNFITYTKQDSKRNGIFGYITVITRGAVYTMHNALLRPSFCISGSESLNAGRSCINIPNGTFDISRNEYPEDYPKDNSFEFLRYKKIKHLVIPCIESFIRRNCGYIAEHSIGDSFRNKFESVNQSIERMTNIRDTLVDLCTV